MKYDISFIIVNYNLADDVINCVNSIYDGLKNISYEVIIVDNNSTEDKSKELTEILTGDNYPDINIYYLEENMGFGIGCNFGFEKSSGGIVCFLNPDTTVNSSLIPMLKFMKNHPKTAVTGPRIFSRNPFLDFSAGFFPNVFFEFLNVFFIGRYSEALILKIISTIKKEQPFNLDWVIGACLLIKRDIFLKIKGFSPDYFMYFEELDLCKKTKNLGFEVKYFPKLQIGHLGSRSTKKDYAFFTYMFYKGKLVFIRKNYNKMQKIYFSIFIFFQLLSQYLLWLFLYPIKPVKSLGKLKGLTLTLRNFKKIQSTKDLSELNAKNILIF